MQGTEQDEAGRGSAATTTGTVNTGDAAAHAGTVAPGIPELGGPNPRAVYRDLLRFGPRSRSELTTRLDLSAPTVTRVTRELLGAQLLHPLGPLAGTKGRPQEPLDIAENDGPRFVGVKVTAEEVHTVLTTVRGNALEELTLTLPDTDPDRLVETVVAPVAALMAAHPHVIGVGLSLGGRVAGRRRVVGSELLGWPRPVDLASLLEERLGLPVAIENDLMAMLHGMHWFGIGRSYHSFVLLTVGAGVGLGVVHAGRVVHGHTHLAGLTGRLPVATAEDGSVVTLGDVARTDRLLARARETGILALDEGVDDLRELLAAGDARAGELTTAMATTVARAAAGAVALLDPQAIILGGETRDLVRAADGVFERTLREAVAPAQQDLVVRDLGAEFDEWARGAAVVAIQEFVGAAS